MVNSPRRCWLFAEPGLGDAFTFDAAGVVSGEIDTRVHPGPGFAGWANYQRRDLLEPLSELKWCHYEEPGNGVLRPESIARIDRLAISTETRIYIGDDERIEEYCRALDAAEWVCDRISYILFDLVGNESSAAWTVDRTESSPNGGDFSLASVAVGQGRHSCLSLFFQPPSAD